MIVMVLMGMLSLLGVIFYTFAMQERSNANYYADAAKIPTAPALTADALFDFALEQIIVGTDQRLKNSVLWGSRHSMLSNALGYGYHRPGDAHPFNGQGVNVIFDSNGNVAVDQDRDGIADPAYAYMLNYNNSPCANSLAERPFYEDNNGNGVLDKGEDLNGNGVLDVYPQTDVGYSYPDINNVFLCYVGKVRDPNNGAVHLVIKPSYLVPGMLRTPNGAGVPTPLIFEDLNFNGILDGGEDTNGNGILDDWCVNPTLGNRVMRAHPNHLYVPPNSSTMAPVSRYLTNTQATALIGPSATGFPFHPMANSYDTTSTGSGVAYLSGRMGPYSYLDPAGLADAPAEFDYDNDGDGYRESILMDLDFPVQQDASGKFFVPLFLVTIHDLDGLVNLNAAGNLARILSQGGTTPVASSTGAPFGTGGGAMDFISKSNLGLGPAEINPAWVLNARPVSTPGNPLDGTGGNFTAHSAFFGGDPRNNTPTPSWAETANMELLWLKIGRPIYSGGSIVDLVAGVYGEEGILYQAIAQGNLSAAGGQFLPRPGVSQVDDNLDVNEGQQSPTTNQFFTVTNWDFQHPLDWTGQGTFLSSAKQINWDNSKLPLRSMIYTKYGNSSTTTSNSYVRYGQYANLMSQSILQGLGDDPYEVAFYAPPGRGADNLLDPSEMIALQLNNTETSRLSINSRVAKLAPFNFSSSSTENARGESIRRKVTTISNDRKNYGLGVSQRTMGASGAGQEYSYDTAPYNPSTQGQYVRNAVNTLRFPPEFTNGVSPVRRYKILQSGESPPIEDPFRPFTRALLEMDNSVFQSVAGIQQKLSVNKLFTIDPTTGKIGFRNLTPHPDDPGVAVISSVANVTNYPPTTAAGQEYWARLDRQQMARDIYVLLYLLGHGNDTVNTATTPNPNPSVVTDGSTLYSEPQLREMAQFAVNMVDAMDRDNVMTRFEYDKDLSDGWNLDDDAYGTIEAGATPYAVGTPNYKSSYPRDSAVRGEVFGIESLDVTISEAMAIYTTALNSATTTPADPDCTPYDDQVGRNFAYVELYNRGQDVINFSATETWQVVLKQDANAGMGVAGFERRVSLGAGAGAIQSGGRFTIGSADSSFPKITTTGRSSFQVDLNGSSGMSWTKLAPTVTLTTPSAIDLVDEFAAGTLTGKATIEDENSNPLPGAGAWASGFGSSPPPSPTIKVVLRRRAHPTRTKLTSANVNDNPWVDVDVMPNVRVGTFDLTDVGTAGSGAMMANIQTQLKQLFSRERAEPLNQNSEQAYPTTSGSNVYNSLAAANNNPNNPPPGTFSIWQPHFDREFASLGELFLIPVFAPFQLSQFAKSMNESPTTQVSNGGARFAVAKFLVPEDPSNYSGMTFNRYLDNRWHRLLELIEVPTRTNYNLALGNEVSIPRVPGRINPNMVRHPDNLAALIDDKNHAALDLSADTGPDPLGRLNDATEAGRDWWQQFVLSRDGVDPYVKATSSRDIPIPGIPSWPTGGTQGSRPFRSLADIGYNYNSTTTTQPHASIDDTMLRSLPMDNGGNPLASRRLLEVGDANDHTNGTVDPVIRHRLLSKILGNTTTRSNSFGVFISVKYFEASTQGGAIRIGGPYNHTRDPEHRGFFVIDRSKIEQGRTSNVMGYDFRSFIEYRKTLKTQ